MLMIVPMSSPRRASWPSVWFARRFGAQRRWVAGFSLAALALAGCNEARELAEPPAVFADVEPILDESCVECHSGPMAEADYRLEDYFQTVRCIPDPEGQPATLPSDQTAPILAVLERPDHADLLDENQTGGLRWSTISIDKIRALEHKQHLDNMFPSQ